MEAGRDWQQQAALPDLIGDHKHVSFHSLSYRDNSMAGHRISEERENKNNATTTALQDLN